MAPAEAMAANVRESIASDLMIFKSYTSRKRDGHQYASKKEHLAADKEGRPNLAQENRPE
jgi:hypothetical protein